MFRTCNSLKIQTNFEHNTLLLAGDSLDYHNGREFSTYDRDNDGSLDIDCAVTRQGAWWYRLHHDGCYKSNLNGKYGRGGHEIITGLAWESWKNYYDTMKKSVMKIRPH